ncbi:hypothetical protein P2318_13140 [Myxococcaceae bacterium GXIMD 01537]
MATSLFDPARVRALWARAQAAILPRSASRAVYALVATLPLFAVLAAIVGSRRLRPGRGFQPYPDLISGASAWTGAYKDYDYFLVMGLLAALFVVYSLITASLNRVSVPRLEDEEDEGEGPALALHLWGGVAAYAASAALFKPAWQELAIAGALGASALVSHLWAWLQRWDVRDFSRRYVASLLAALGLGLSSLGVVMAIRCFSPGALTGVEERAVPGAVALLAMATVLPMVMGSRLSLAGWRRLALGAQVLSPLLILHVGHGVYQRGQEFIQRNVPDATRWGLLAVAVAGAGLIFARLWRTPPALTRLTPSECVAWPTVVAVSCWIAFQPLPWSLLTYFDDFHLGEILIPWQQVVEQGQPLYYGFVSIQWWLGLLYGALNALLFTGTGSSFTHAVSVWPILTAGLAAALLCWRVGPAWGLVLSLFVLPIKDRQYLVLPILLVLAAPTVLVRPWLWLTAWGGLSLLHTFYNPTAGLALGLGLLPVAVLLVVQAVRDRHAPGAARPWPLVVVGVLGILVLTLLSRQLLGIVEFIRSNGAINTTAYGIALMDQPEGPEWFPMRGRVAWEAFRTGGWVLGSLVLWVLFCRARLGSAETRAERASTQVIAWASVAFCVFLIPYSMGRLDERLLSGSGNMTLMVLSTLIPLSMVLESRWRRRLWLVPVIVGALVGLRGSVEQVEPLAFVVRPLASIQVPEGTLLQDGRELGLPKLGTQFIHEGRVQELRGFSKVLAEFLEPSESYFDLSNRTAFYYYFDLSVPAHYASDYTAVGEFAQERVLEALKRNPPPLVRLGPGSRFDGGSASLRSFRIYRWLLEQGYGYHEKEGHQFLLRPDRLVRVPSSERVKDAMAGLREAFYQRDLAFLPMLWGQSWMQLAPRFARESLPLTGNPWLGSLEELPDGGLRAVGEDPQLIWTLPRAVAGREFEFLYLDLQMDCDTKTETWPQAQVFWNAARGFAEERSFIMVTRQSPLLIPIGSHPEWLLAERIQSIRFDLNSYGLCGPFHIKDARLLRLER